MEHSRETWVYAEQRGGRLSRVSLELLSKGTEISRELRGGLVAVLVGSGVEPLASELVSHGADRVYVIDDPRLKHYHNQAYAAVIADLVTEHRPEVFLLGATAIGEDLAPCIAAKVGTGLTAHCIDLRMEERDGVAMLHQTVPGWGGGKRVDIICPRSGRRWPRSSRASSWSLSKKKTDTGPGSESHPAAGWPALQGQDRGDQG